MSETIYSETGMLSLLVALARLSQTLPRAGATIRDALELAPLVGDEGVRRLLLAAARALRGDIPGALEILEESGPLPLEAAARLEDALASAGAEAGARTAVLAEWAGSRLLYFDSAILYVEAVRTRLQWALLRPLDRLSAILLAADLWPQAARPLEYLSERLRSDLCYPRRYCPMEPPMNSEEARSLYHAAREAWALAGREKLPGREALLDRLLQRVEAPRLAEAASTVVGRIPGIVVALRPEDLERADATVIAYDNTIPYLRRAVERLPGLGLPLYMWAGASVEELWLGKYGRRLLAASRDEMVAAPLASVVEGAKILSALMPGSRVEVHVEGETLEIRSDSLGVMARLSGPEGVARARRAVEESVARLVEPLEGWREKALARAVLRLLLGSPHEYGEPAHG